MEPLRAGQAFNKLDDPSAPVRGGFADWQGNDRMRFTASGYLWVALVSLLALILNIVLALNVARSRTQYGVQAPATTGHPAFERALRIHANTAEQLAAFVTALWLCAIYLQPLAAAILGFIWIFGRIVYGVGYAADPSKRVAGFVVSVVALVLLIVGALVGVIRAFLAQP
jgi:glutathione S-transferase